MWWTHATPERRAAYGDAVIGHDRRTLDPEVLTVPRAKKKDDEPSDE